MPPELIIFIAALVVSWLIFTALVKILKTTVTTAIGVAILVLALQLLFGIGPNDLWQQMLHLPQNLWDWITDQ